MQINNNIEIIISILSYFYKMRNKNNYKFQTKIPCSIDLSYTKIKIYNNIIRKIILYICNTNTSKNFLTL